jgi:hypothetical protein
VFDNLLANPGQIRFHFLTAAFTHAPEIFRRGQCNKKTGWLKITFAPEMEFGFQTARFA